MTKRYRRKDGIPGQPMGEDLMVFDQHADRVHILNSTAAFVWECLERETDAETIGSRIASSFRLSGDVDLPGTVEATLREFEEKGLIEEITREEKTAG